MSTKAIEIELGAKSELFNYSVTLASRIEARREKNWEAADEPRIKLLPLGYNVDDTVSGVHIRKL